MSRPHNKAPSPFPGLTYVSRQKQQRLIWGEACSGPTIVISMPMNYSIPQLLLFTKHLA